MKRILGLDLGVSSIGWALVNEAEKKYEDSSIEKLGVRVNTLAVDEQQDFEKGKSITTNADRTLKRGMRRSLQRYKLRRKNLIECLLQNGIINDSTILCENGNNTTFETYRLRAKSANEEVSLEAFARILLMINKKRGYKSNRKAKGEDEGSVIDGMSIAQELYDKNITPGQYVYERLRINKKYIPEFYRSDLQAEFDTIYKKQKEHYPEILTDELYNELLEKNGRTSRAIISKHGIEIAENKNKDKRIQFYNWRSEAVSKQQPIEIVAAVLCDINSLINSSSNYLGAIGDRSKELYFKKITVGQALMQRIKENPNASLKNTVYYRQDYLDEFERIWETQSIYHKELTPELKREIRDIIIFYQRNLKSQKGLINLCEFEKGEIEIEIDGKYHRKSIGHRVCPKSSPLFQEFKIWQILNNLVVENSETNEKWTLTLEEKQILFNELSTKDKLKKSEVLKLLYKNYRELDLNYKELEGNRTIATLLKACETIIPITGHNEYNFSKMRSQDIYDVIDRIFGAAGINSDFIRFDSEAQDIEKEPMYRLWHLIYSYTDDKSKSGNESLIRKIAQKTGMDTDCARIFASITFQEDYGSLSSKAIAKILPHLKDGNSYDKACAYAGYRHSVRSITTEERITKEYRQQLELLPRNSLRNPVVEKILNQMINVVNAIVTEYGKPDEIRIELARELKSNAQEREKMTIAISDANKRNEKIRKILHDSPFNIANPSRNDILRYRLYEELKENGFKTLYSNTYISQEELFSNKFDIEHIIPQSRLFDDSYSNKTLEARDVNIEKGNSTAYDYIANKFDENSLQEYKNRIDSLYKKGVIGKTKRDKLLMQGKDIPENFIDRDLRNTQYISKKACEILEELVPYVVATSGNITDRLRQDWELIDVMQELNWDKYKALGLTHTIVNREGKEIHRITDWTKRNDHRHHAMDALTVAFTKRSIIQYLNTLNAKGNNIEDEKHAIIVKRKFAIPFKGFREAARLHLETVLISIKSKSKVVTRNTNTTKAKKEKQKSRVQLTPRGQLHKETIYGSCHRYVKYTEKIGSSFDATHIKNVANKKEREALLARLNEFGNDAKKAFTGKNSLEKNPIYIDKAKTIKVPEKVTMVRLEKIYTIRKKIDSDLSIDKVIDPRIREILYKRLAEYNDDAKAAFSNLDENPIWLNRERGICIKRVAITGISSAVALREKRDHFGNPLLDKEGKKQEADYVSTGNNHNVAIYIDEEGYMHEKITSFYEATALAIEGLPVVDKEYNSHLGWRFCFSMKQNEYFVFPNEKSGFDPNEIDLMSEKNLSLISPNLYRVQKISIKDYFFRHHLETTVEDVNTLKDTTWKRITALKNLKGIVKVRINHLGKIVHVGE